MKIQILLILGFGFQAALSQAGSDLNAVLNFVIGEMIEDKFFESTWEQYFVGIVPVAIPNVCNENGAKLIDRADADESLSSVLDRGTLRVGISKVAASIPSLYSIVNGTDNPRTDLSSGPYGGYEIASAEKVAERLSAIYGVDLYAEFVLIDADSYFESMRDALNDGTIDVIWSSMTINEERAREVDFTCYTFATEYVIAASPEVGKAAPSSTGPEIPVACIAVFCDLKFPPPFVPVELEGNQNSIQGLKDVLIDPNDQFDYIVLNFEDLRLFFRDSCRNCTIVDMSPLEFSYQAPSTKIVNITISSKCSETAPENGSSENCSEHTSSAFLEWTAQNLCIIILSVVLMIL